MSIIDEIMRDSLNKKIPRFKAGDTVRVYLKIKEGEKERIQYYEGVVIAIHNNGISTTFKVRKESYGVGVERTFPLFSPLVQKIEVKRRGDVRRAKLYYLRKLSGKRARIKERKDWMLKKSEVEALEAEDVFEQEVPVSEEAVAAAAAELAEAASGEIEAAEASEAAPEEKEAAEAKVEDTAEPVSEEDAAADAPAVEEEEREAEPVAETAEPVSPEEGKSPEEKAPEAKAARKKSGKDAAKEGEGKEEKTARKPRKTKSEPTG